MRVSGTNPSAHQQRGVKGGVRERYWPGTLMGLSIFIVLPTLFTVATWTLMDPMLLLRVLVVLCFAGNLLPYLHSGLWLGMERLEWFLFNLIAVGPLSTCLLLWLNFLFHGPETTTVHGVLRVETDATLCTYHFVDAHLHDFPFARSTYRDWFPIVGDQVRTTEAIGLFGVPVLVSKEPFVSGS